MMIHDRVSPEAHYFAADCTIASRADAVALNDRRKPADLRLFRPDIVRVRTRTASVVGPWYPSMRTGRLLMLLSRLLSRRRSVPVARNCHAASHKGGIGPYGAASASSLRSRSSLLVAAVRAIRVIRTK